MDGLDVVDVIDEVVPVASFWRFRRFRGVKIEVVVRAELIIVVWVCKWDVILIFFVSSKVQLAGVETNIVVDRHDYRHCKH